MLKKITFFLLLISSQNLFSQVRYDGIAVFKGRDTINFTYQDEAARLPKYKLNISPFGPSFDYIGYKIQGVYRQTPRLLVRASVNGTYIPEVQDMLDARFALEYALFTKTKQVKRKINLKHERNTFWVVEELNHEKRKFLGVDIGAGYCNIGRRVLGGGYLGESPRFLGVTSSLSFQASGSGRRDSNLDGKVTTSSSYLTSRIYFNFSYGLLNLSQIYKYDSLTNSDVRVKNDSNVIPKGAYWRLGWEGEIGFNKSPFSFVVGAELGSSPYYIIQTYDGDLFRKGGMFQVHLGIGIGQNPWKHKNP